MAYPNYCVAAQAVVRPHVLHPGKSRLRNLQSFLRITELHVAPSNLILDHRSGILCKLVEVQRSEFIKCFLVVLLKQKDVDVVCLKRLCGSAAPPKIDKVRMFAACGGNVFSSQRRAK